MVRRQTVVLITVLVLGVALGGCIDGVGGDDGVGGTDAGGVASSENTTALAETAAETMTGVDSYTAVEHANSSTSTAGQSIEQTVEATRSVDSAEQRLWSEQTVTGGLRGTETTVETYYLDQTQYVQLQGSWQAQELPRDPWANSTVSGTVELLTEYDVSRVGTETVDGVETAVLEIEDSDALSEKLTERRAQSAGQLAAQIEIRSATLRFYVGLEDPHYVHRIDTEMTTELQGPNGQGVETEIDQTTRYDDFEANVTVDVPADVEALHSE